MPGHAPLRLCLPTGLTLCQYARAMNELPIIQKTYDLLKWYVPILNQLSRDHKFALGDRIISGLYDLLEGLLRGCLKSPVASSQRLDPPKSPLKRGTLNPVPPFLRGARGDRRVVCITPNTF
jgi:hypothetical protein